MTKKLFLLFFISVFISSCKSKQTVSKPEDALSVIPETISEAMDYLTSDDLKGRNTTSEGIDKAASFIENVFSKANVKPYFTTYRDSFPLNQKYGYNVVGFLEGHDQELKNEYIVIGAHYDHIGFGRKVDNDSIANGANDNASGTSVVLALSRYFAIKKNNKRSVIFALFSGEEMGLLGSKHLGEKLKNENLNLYTMINFEMLGVPLSGRDYDIFLTGYETSNMANVMNTYANSNFVGFSDISKQYNLFMRSDNFAFYQQFHVPSHTISSCDLSNFDYYHHVDDELDKIDLKFMSDVTIKLAPVMEALCNSTSQEIKLNEE